MASNLPVIDDDGEVGDLFAVDPSLFKPLSPLPVSLQAQLKAWFQQHGTNPWSMTALL